MTELKGKVVNVDINDQMKSAYIDYSMSVIVSRALPDVRDGLKPVHRRVLFGMRELALWHNRPYKKSARIVGEVLGKYHPHGDLAVYESMVRMAQPWSLRYQLVDGQGNFGSLDGDSPAAMRYTEARLMKIAEEMLADIEKDTVDFKSNFDDTLEEPVVLPAAIPNLLINGSSGIAVGMATNIPPHNLSEVIDAIIQYIDNRDISIEELMKYVKAPDFPTGGIIYGYDGVIESYKTGRGRIILRGKAEIETLDNGKQQIIVTELPYQVNKSQMIIRTAELVTEKVIDGITDLRDESDRDGVRVVYELRKDANPQVVLNNLYKFTPLQSSFSVNAIALVKNKPKTLTLKDFIVYFVEHRHEVVIRRAKYELAEAEKRAHVLEGLLIALDNIDEVISLIRGSRTQEEAKNGLIERFSLSEIQAKAILEMRLQRLVGLERDKLRQEYEEVMQQIERLRQLLADESLRMELIKSELLEIKSKYGDERRTEIVHSADDINIKDIIPNDEFVITITHNGYIKRTLLAEYRTQKRGGRGSKATGYRDNDFVKHIFVSKAHNYLLLFTNKGKCYWQNVYELPEGEKNTKGRPIQNLIQLEPSENIKAFLSVEDLEDENYIKNTYIVFATQQGQIKKTPLEAYSRPRAGGIKAITINEGDELIEVIKTDGNSWIMLGSLYGQAVRFHESDVRPMGRTAAGVRGIRLSRHKDDRVVGMLTVNDENETILPITENGYGKRSPLSEYRITKRGGKGVRTMNITEKTGKLVAIGNVIEDEEVMIITKSGLAIRLKVSNVRVMGRATQGVRLIRLIDGDQVVSVARVISDSDEEEIDNDTENMVISKEEQEKEEVVEAPDNDEDETDEAEPDDEQITENE